MNTKFIIFFKKRNDTGELIDFSRGENCICPTSNPYWKNDVKDKYLKKEPRHMIRKYAEKKDTNMD